MKELAEKIRTSLVELLFPGSCLACGEAPESPSPVMLCPRCRAAVNLISGPLCRCCGKQFQKAAGSDHLCGLCLKGYYHFEVARSLISYRPPVTTIISSFKYHGQTTSLKSFRSFQLQSPSLTELKPPEIIMPVPLHRKRLQERGFNQALLLARTFYPDQHHLINFQILERARYTEPQTSLSGKRRRDNLKNAFLIKNWEKIEGKRIMLIDDVFTTGTTVNECARVLKKAGAKEVQVLTLARVD